jgi:hypothetical protein
MKVWTLTSKSKINFEELLHADEEKLEEALNRARSISWRTFGKKITFYAPSFIHYETEYFRSSPITFPSISITGSFCALKCKHCGNKILETMIPATTPQELLRVCIDLKRKGCVGCLISGGCLPDGSVPVGRFIEAIARVKKELGLTVVVHTGIIDIVTARELKKAGVDAALIDIIGSDDTIHKVYKLNAKVEDYDRSLMALQKSGIPFVPHVLVGLHYGKLKGEIRSLKIISKYAPSAVIVVALMPIDGTPMENVDPPSPEDVARVLAAARLMLTDVPIVLGCARPKGEHKIRTDMLAVKTGVNAIAFPAEEAIRLAEALGLQITFSPFCCSQIFQSIP